MHASKSGIKVAIVATSTILTFCAHKSVQCCCSSNDSLMKILDTSLTFQRVTPCTNNIFLSHRTFVERGLLSGKNVTYSFETYYFITSPLLVVNPKQIQTIFVGIWF